MRNGAASAARTGAVDSVTIAAGVIAGRVTGSTGNRYDVSIQAAPVPARAWQDTVRSARSRPPLAPAVEGRVQSVHLAHLMSTEHGASLAPAVVEVRRSCTCPDGSFAGACKHVAAVAFAGVGEVDENLVLRVQPHRLADQVREVDPVALARET